MDPEQYLAKLARAPFVPTNTYRLQLSPKFPFQEAIKWIPYLKKLGVNTIYTAPYFQATPGSMHGYDISSPLKLNPELGNERDYEEFCKTLTKNEMGHVADLVANHMSATEHNEWWWDVLENGRFSIYSLYFDIDWNPIREELKNKVLIPVLQKSLPEAMQNGSLSISLTEGKFTLHLDHHFFPICPDSYPLLLQIEEEELQRILHDDHRVKSQYLAAVSFFENLPEPTEVQEVDRYRRRMLIDQAKRALVEVLRQSKILYDYIQRRLDFINQSEIFKQVLEKQYYQLTHWQEGPQSINYRRFFDINELAALRVEDIEVFKHFHSLLFRFIIENRIQGLRVDHPDGFYEPATYLEWLQRFYLENKLEEEFAENPSEEIDFYECKSLIWKKGFEHKDPVYVVVEKILEEGEALPSTWDVQGTVGYEYLNALNGLFVDTANEKAFSEVYQDFTSMNQDPEHLLYEQKKKYTCLYMMSEVNVLTKNLFENAKKFEKNISFNQEELKEGIVELFATFPIYRTYVARLDSHLTERDKSPIIRAFEKAKGPKEVLDFLERVFMIDDHVPGAERSIAYRDFILSFQQISPPIMAKGFEDTFLYIYNRFVSLNEVGGNPMRFGISADEFHHQNRKRLENWPRAFISTSTHDTKRSEDLRYRLNVLSEMPKEWKKHVNAWKAINERHNPPDSNAEYLLYQTMVGFFPFHPPSDAEKKELLQRLKEYMRKTAREAKVYTNWVENNLEYENGLLQFIEKIFSEPKFWKDFLPFQQKIAQFGVYNSLSALVLKMGSPGVVDTYQGMELFDFSLVDPDNRRPVDFALRKSILESTDKLEEFDKIKMTFLRKGLNLRLQFKDLFLEGEYVPLEIEGSLSKKIVGFVRRKEEAFAIFLVVRYFTDLIEGKEAWQDTRILFPKEFVGKSVIDQLLGKEMQLRESHHPSEIFSSFYQAILVGR